MQKGLVLSLLILLGMLFSGCATQEFKAFEKNANNIETNITDAEYEEELSFEYKIVPGDRIQISVFNQSSGGGGQLSQVISRGGLGDTYLLRDGYEGMKVPQNGKIRLPLINEIEVAGLTEIEAAEKITKAYKKYLRNPFASVKILDQRLFVLGEVKKPGVIKVPHGTMTLFEALAHSGDLTDDAKRTDILVIRGDLRNPKIRKININDISAIRMSSLILRPNDIVYVTPRDMKAYNVAFNEQKPFWELLSAMLEPFVQFRYIKDGYNLHGFGD